MWNYRVVKCTDESEGEEWLEIREVYYDQLGKPMGHCTATVGGESLAEVEIVLGMMAQSLSRAVLKFKEEPTKAQLELDLKNTIDTALESLKAACGVAPKYRILADGAVYFYMDKDNE